MLRRGWWWFVLWLRAAVGAAVVLDPRRLPVAPSFTRRCVSCLLSHTLSVLGTRWGGRGLSLPAAFFGGSRRVFSLSPSAWSRDRLTHSPASSLLSPLVISASSHASLVTPAVFHSSSLSHRNLSLSLVYWCATSPFVGGRLYESRSWFLPCSHRMVRHRCPSQSCPACDSLYNKISRSTRLIHQSLTPSCQIAPSPPGDRHTLVNSSKPPPSLPLTGPAGWGPC